MYLKGGLDVIIVPVSSAHLREVWHTSWETAVIVAAPGGAEESEATAVDICSCCQWQMATGKNDQITFSILL